MAGDWTEVSLGDFIDIRHGFAFKGEFIHNEARGDLLLTPGNFAIGGGFKADKFKYYDGLVPIEFVLSEHDLLVTMTDLSKQSDTLGYPAFVPQRTDGRRYLHNQRLGKVVLRDQESLDIRYLYYLMCSQKYRHEVLASATGTTVKHTSPERIKQFRFMCPPPPEQRAIAHILGTLDDKIELNRRMNETLVATARIIFKSWFADFDPMRTKAGGRNPSLPGHVARLFPASFEKSELGEIPAGWRIVRLGELLSVIETGGRPKGGVKEVSEGVPSVGAESIVGLGSFDYSKTKFVPRSFFEAMSRGHVRDGDVLLYKDGGRPGEFEPHVTLVGDDFPFPEFSINEHVYRLRSEPVLPQSYLYFWLSAERAMEEMRNRGTGVAVPGLNSTAVRELAVLLPSAVLLRVFDERVSALIHRVFGNCNESHTLATVRDTILPALLSGEVRVKEAEKGVERVV